MMVEVLKEQRASERNTARCENGVAVLPGGSVLWVQRYLGTCACKLTSQHNKQQRVRAAEVCPHSREDSGGPSEKHRQKCVDDVREGSTLPYS